MKKFLSKIFPKARLIIAAATGFSVGRGVVALHDYYLSPKKTTLKEFYEEKYGNEPGKEVFLPLPENINGEWSKEEMNKWQNRVSDTWFFRDKRRSINWIEILKKFDSALNGSKNKSEANQKAKSLTKKDLMPVVETCKDIANLILDDIKDDAFEEQKTYMRDSWVACSYKGTISSLDKDWPMYDGTITGGY